MTQINSTQKRLMNELLSVAHAYCRHVGKLPSTIGKESVRNARIFEAPTCTIKIYGQLMQWFSDRWPEVDMPWPNGVPRPDPENPARKKPAKRRSARE